MGGHHMRDVVEQLGQMAAEVGVPGVAVDQVDALDVGRHPQADRHGAQGRSVPVRRNLSPGLVAGDHQLRLAGGAEAEDRQVDQPGQLPAEILDMDAGAPVHLGRKLPGQ